IPSMELQCTSRTPSPSSSRAYSPWFWLTVACPRPRRASGLYPLHSSVYTIAPGLVAGRTVVSTDSSARLRCPTRAHSRPLVRPTVAGTGGRSVSQVPWPLAWFARRRGGSSGSVCGTPFFPRVLVHLVGLGLIVRQRRAVRGGQGAGLDDVPQPQRMLAADPHLMGEFRGRHPLRDAPEDQEDLARAEVCTLPGGAGKHVEDPTAAFAAVVEDRRLGAMAMDVQPVPGGATGAGQAAGMEQVQELVVATILVHQVEDREVHEVNSQEIIVDTPDGQENTTAGGLEGPTTKLVT